jgi:predicted nucleic acid-binding protein
MDEAVLLDTDVWSLLYVSSRKSSLPHVSAWRDALTGRVVAISAQTQAEVLFGALSSGWGPSRREQLTSRLAEFPTLPVSAAVIEAHAELRAQCAGHGHALGHKAHMGDAWVAATAIGYELPLAAIDGIYRGAPGLRLVLPSE